MVQFVDQLGMDSKMEQVEQFCVEGADTVDKAELYEKETVETRITSDRWVVII